MLYIRNNIPFAFRCITTSMMRADSTLHVILHVNALKLFTSEVVFDGARVVQCLHKVVINFSNHCSSIKVDPLSLRCHGVASQLMIWITCRKLTSHDFWVVTSIRWEIPHVTWCKFKQQNFQWSKSMWTYNVCQWMISLC